ncbi:MAG: KilA-N domain-containing protein [Gemmatimonadetes bacterium]|nr:KilA-N domain-containing protein [Gemmatimonadota bacterium]
MATIEFDTRALPIPQQQFLIQHPVGEDLVPQRPQDGYINATKLCQQAGRRFNDYHRLDSTQAFLEALALEAGIPASKLTHTIRGRGDAVDQGTWVHPRVAINLAQWLSPEFAVQVTQWVIDWIEGRARNYMPVHIQRFLKNKSKIPHTHFSMLNEIYLELLAPLEDRGVILPDKMMPDISTGRMFSGFLRRKGIDPSEFPTYAHEFVDTSRPTVNARLYPVEYLPEFRKYFYEVWLQKNAEAYFAKRYENALPHLEEIRKLPPPDA